MPSLARIRDLDAQAWRTATWAAPFVVQLVLAAQLMLMWLLGTWPFATHSPYTGERAWMLSATAITTLVSLAISGVLLTSRSSRGRGLALSVAGSAAVVFVGGVIYALWLLR